jgi:hypothetical protein
MMRRNQPVLSKAHAVLTRMGMVASFSFTPFIVTPNLYASVTWHVGKQRARK